MTQVAMYELVRELGRGTSGVVHLAVDPTGRRVALKRMIRLDPRSSERALRESSVRIAHPNVVEVLGAGLDAEGQVYVATEYLEGSTLAARLETSVPIPTLVEWIAAAADGIAALHARGVVHRDVKPTNLFVTREGRVKVLDFGAAAYVDATTSLTPNGAIVGTPAYLSPEQAQGAENVDARADVWALGVILYEGLMGKRPFERTSPLASMLAATVQPTPTIGLTNGEPLEELIGLCLRKDPKERPSAAELASRLRALLPQLARARRPAVASSRTRTRTPRPPEHPWIASVDPDIFESKIPHPVSDAEVDHVYETLYEWAKTLDQDIAWIVDLRSAGAATARQRSAVARHELRIAPLARPHLRGIAFYGSNTFTRGAIQAILWLTSPQYPYEVFPTREEALAWARQQLARARDAQSPRR